MFEIKTLKDGLKKIAPRTKTKAITDDDNKNLDTILSEKANSADVPSKVSQLTNDTGFITNAALDNYPNNTQMNAAINSHHDDTKQDKLAAQTPYTNVGSKNKIPKITTNTLGQVTNVEEVDIEAQQANLSQNLAYANDNDSSIVRHVSSDIVINSTDSSIYHKLIKTIYEINNGIENEIITPLAYFNKKYFNNNDNIFSLNINNIISGALLLDGSNILYNPVSNLNNFSTGVGLFHNGENLPFTTTSLIISGSHQKNNALIQLALNYNGEIKYRVYDLDKNVWKEWISLFIDNLSSSNNYCGLSAKQGRILNEKITAETNRATNAESTLTTDLSNEVTRAKAKENELNTKFANYLLKSDAPGYGDILTNANAKTTYVAKTDATGYNDILTKTLASTTYETTVNASATYVSKTEAVGYDDILTKTLASTTYVSKTDATATYETKQHASATYVSQNSLIDKIYPIGSIYLSVSNTNPSTLFEGTTWEQIKDRFLLASGDTYTALDMGGEAEHILTTNEMPKHRHGYNSFQEGYPSNYIGAGGYKTPLQRIPWTDFVAENTYGSETGSSQAHNNMPPYLVVNIWKRVS